MVEPRGKGLSKAELAGLLAESLGEEKAREAVSESASRLGLQGQQHFDREEVLKILELLAKEPGLVGVVARFAKARAILAVR